MPALNYPIGALHDVMRATAARFPDRPAITFKDSVITFAEFDRDSNQLANGFAALGVTAGDRIALYLPNCPPYELAFYAASKLGAIACPMNPSYREREITYHVNDSGAKVMSFFRCRSTSFACSSIRLRSRSIASRTPLKS